MSETGQGVPDNMPKTIGNPATRALHNAGYDRLEQLTTATTKELLNLHGFGPRALRLLREALAEQGQTFADERGDKSSV